jgi:1-acyl-sn-glycerol-3-phosphate acyltransferase
MTDPPLAVLAPFERWAVRVARRMNHGRWPRLWCWCQRHVGARWIALLAEPLFEVHGLAHVTATSRDRPLLVVVNHRTFFDLYVLSTVLFRRTTGWRSIHFPVRGRYFYQHPGGVAVNLLIAQWAMYPPFFHTPSRRRFDQWALEELCQLCRAGPGRLIGFHPEGTRNRGPDPWNLLPPQAGIGRLLYEARPAAIPVFIGGLTQDLGEVLRRRRRGGERIRIRFGAPLEYREYLDRPAGGATYRALAAMVMARIAALAREDRGAVLAAAAPGAPLDETDPGP